MTIRRHGRREELIRATFDPALRARARKVFEMLEAVIREHEVRVLGEDHEPEPLDEERLGEIVQVAILGRVGDET